jgi:hypothetical protein
MLTPIPLGRGSAISKQDWAILAFSFFSWLFWGPLFAKIERSSSKLHFSTRRVLFVETPCFSTQD